MIILLVLTIIGSVAYLSYAYYQQKLADNEREDKIKIAQGSYLKAQIETELTKIDLLQYISEVYGQISAEKVKNRKIWIGMNRDLLVAAWGWAGDIKDTYVRGERIEKWYYKPYYNRLNNLKYKFEITISNDEVTGWKDLA